ncbi:MAG: FAD-binding oxidoreductase, partial [Caldimicrobium sp.]
EEALETIKELLIMGLTPASAEFVDKTSFLVCKENMELLIREINLTDKVESLLFLEIDGRNLEVLEESRLIEEYLKGRALLYIKREEEKEIEDLWEIRRNISPALKKLAPKKKADDIVVPRSKMREFLRFLRELELKYSLFISAFGHVGDGNFHVNLLYEDEAKACEVRETILKKVLELHGTISGEHGIGYLKQSYVRWELEPHQMEIMKKIKKIFDPKGLLNPQIKLPE